MYGSGPGSLPPPAPGGIVVAIPLRAETMDKQPVRTEKKPRSALRRAFKWTGIVVGTLIALLIIAIVVIPHVVNTGPVKREIQNVASRSSGRAVTIAGPLSLSLFPWVGFDAADVTMANAPGFGDRPFMHVKELEIHVKLIPLLFHKVEVSGITLDAPTLNLERRADGVGNWQDLTGGGGSGGSSGAGGGGLAGLTVGSLAVHGATLDYTDAQAHKRYTISDAALEASHIAPGGPFPLNASLKLASSQPHADVQIKLDTKAQFDATLKQIALGDGSLSMRISNAGLGSGPLDIDARWQKIALDESAGTATLSALALKVANLSARLDATARGIGKSPTLTGRLVVPSFAPRKLLDTLGSPIPTTLHGFDQASLTGDVAATADSIRLSNLTLKLDDTTLTGRAAIADLKKSALRFDLAADRINLDTYLPPGAGQAAHATTPHGKSFMDTRLPGSMLKKLDISGKLTVSRITGLGLALQNFAVQIYAANGAVHLNPVTADLYGGNYAGKVTATAAGPGVRLETTQNLKQVQAGQLIAALAGRSNLSGTADATIALAGQGDTVAELFDNLKGTTVFSLQHGAIEGFNLWQSLEQAYALIKDHKKLPSTGPDKTEFANIQGSANIANGVITNDALNAALAFVSITGHGTVDLNKEHVDYDLLGKVVKPPQSTGIDLSKLEGITVPVHVSGDFNELTSVPDMKQALTARAKAELQKKLDAQKKSAQDKLKQKLQDLLNSGGGGGGG